MLSRTLTTSTVGRAGARRRQRRRAGVARRPYYCATNGCASFLDLEVEAGRAVCPVCGFSRSIG
jgi:hypothetical protein